MNRNHSNLFDIDLWNLTSETTSNNENSLEIVSDENLNLNKNLLGGDVGERGGGGGGMEGGDYKGITYA